jgi:hypothetical protein
MKKKYLASLNCDFLKIGDGSGDDEIKDEFPLVDLKKKFSNLKKQILIFKYEKKVDEENPDLLEKAKLEEENLNKLKNLFKGLKFFLNREVPREQFVLAIK